jgi:hypothetical protein
MASATNTRRVETNEDTVGEVGQGILIIERLEPVLPYLLLLMPGAVLKHVLSPTAVIDQGATIAATVNLSVFGREVVKTDEFITKPIGQTLLHNGVMSVKKLPQIN